MVEIMDKGCLKKMEDEDYLVKVEVVEEDCSMNIHDCFGAHYQQGFDHRV